MEEFDLYTVKFTYKGREFSHVFDREEMRLILFMLRITEAAKHCKGGIIWNYPI